MTCKKLFNLGIITSLVLALALTAGAAAPASAREVAAAPARPEVQVVEIKTTPGLVEPIDVLTLNTTMHNNAERADGLVVEITVKDQGGQTVQEMRQLNIGVHPSDDMAVYWVWRIPQRVNEGTYSVQVTVYDPDGTRVIAQEQKTEAFAVMKTEREEVY